MNALVTMPQNNVEIYRASTDAASLCKDIVVQTAKRIGDRNYVQVEGWQAIAIAHGCAASAGEVERIDGGVRAIGEVRRMADGALIARAEGFVGEDEPTWFGGEERTKWGVKQRPKRPDYAIRAMAQTRAISRACRSAFAHVVVMMNAGLSTTPAEEVPDGGFIDADYSEAPRQRSEVEPPKAESGPLIMAKGLLQSARSKDEFTEVWNANKAGWKGVMSDADYRAIVKVMHAEAVRWTDPKPEPADGEFGDLAGAAEALGEAA